MRDLLPWPKHLPLGSTSNIRDHISTWDLKLKSKYLNYIILPLAPQSWCPPHIAKYNHSFPIVPKSLNSFWYQLKSLIWDSRQVPSTYECNMKSKLFTSKMQWWFRHWVNILILKEMLAKRKGQQTWQASPKPSGEDIKPKSSKIILHVSYPGNTGSRSGSPRL